MARTLARARIHAMDLAHWTNAALTRAGLRVPGPLRRRIARVMEGG